MKDSDTWNDPLNFVKNRNPLQFVATAITGTLFFVTASCPCKDNLWICHDKLVFPLLGALGAIGLYQWKSIQDERNAKKRIQQTILGADES